MSKPKDAPRRSRAPKIVAGTVGGLALLGGGTYVAGYFMAGDKTPKNASAAGIAIGSMSPQEAEAKLRAALGPAAEAPIVLKAGDKTAQIKPAESGLVVDYAKTIEAAGAGRSWKPQHILNVLRGGSDLPLVVTSDKGLLKQKVEAVAPTFATQPKDASIALEGTTAKVTEGQQGTALDVAQATDKVASAWRTSTTVEAPITTSDPALTTDEVNKLNDEQLKPLLSGPITVQIGDKQVKVTPEQIAAATTITAKDGAVSASTDIEKVYTAIAPEIDKLDFGKGKDATITIKDGKPSIVPSVDGMGVAKDDVVKAIQPALTKTGDARTVKVAVTKQPAKFSTADAQKMGVKEVIGEFTTEFPYAEYRNVNLTKAAAMINGRFLKPGETFSLDKTLGVRSEANGWASGWVIQGGVMKKETGGGISQSATTTFNAIFFAGLEDVEHHPHTLYFPRYPAGREATLYGGKLDLRFRNNTQYGVVMQAYTVKAKPGGKGSITVRVWSTKTWDKVESSPLVKSNYEYGRRIESTDPECSYQAPIAGFDVNYSRLFWKGGKVVRTEKFHWRYQPGDEIVCKNG